MGSLVTGRCSCGYVAERLYVGVGLNTIPGVRLGPCLCRKCRQAVSADVMENPPECLSCEAKGAEPYVDPHGGKKQGAQNPRGDDSEPLFDSRFECPACGKKSLKFEFAGMWD